MRVVGVYSRHNKKQKKSLDIITSVITDLRKRNHDCVGVIPYEDLDKVNNVDCVVSAFEKSNSVTNTLSKYKYALSVTQCRFHRYYNVRENGELFYLFVGNDWEKVYPIYKPGLDSVRRERLNLPCKNNVCDNNGFVLIAHNHTYYDRTRGKNEYFKKAVEYCHHNNIKFKVCFHPSIQIDSDEAGKDYRLELIDECNGIDLIYGGKASSHYHESKCVIAWEGRIVNECIIENIPVYTGVNILTRDILKQDYTLEEFIDNPVIMPYEKRQEWLNWLSYTNWNLEEIRSGEALDYLIPIWRLK